VGTIGGGTAVVLDRCIECAADVDIRPVGLTTAVLVATDAEGVTCTVGSVGEALNIVFKVIPRPRDGVLPLGLVAAMAMFARAAVITAPLPFLATAVLEGLTTATFARLLINGTAVAAGLS